jgi:hypothetical protein
MIQALHYLRATLSDARAFTWTVGLSLLALSAPAGFSQDTAPQLTAIALTSASPLSAGSNLAYTFSVTPGTYPIISISIDIDDPNGYDYLIAGNIFAGTITFQTATNWVNGNYTVRGININDGHSDTTYPLVGTVTNSSGETVVATNPVTSSLNFVLTGGVTSVTGPTVVSFTPINSDPIHPLGSVLVYNLNLTLGTRNDLTEVDLLVRDPNGGQENLQAEAGPLTGSLAIFPLTGLTLTGAYTVLGLEISDGYGSETFSSAFGSSAIFETPGTAAIDFSSLGFTLIPVPVDPQLASISLSVPDPTSFSYNVTATQGTYPVSSVVVWVKWPTGIFQPLSANLPGTGFTYFGSVGPDGRYTVTQIDVTDSMGFGTQYAPDGSVTEGSGGTGPSTNSFNWASLDFTVSARQIVPLGVSGDINHDGKPDIFWTNTSSGDRGAYLMNGTTTVGWADFGTVRLAWRIGAVADFKGNGRNDILWQNTTTGECGFYLMNGTTVTGWAELGTIPTAWRAAAAADFEGNGNNDILWQNTSTGECGFYLMSGTTVTGWAELGIVDPSWRIAAAADFDGDGNPDILWQNTVTGECGIYIMNGTAVTGWASLGTIPTQWQAVAVGNFSGNGSNDILWQNTSTGECGFYIMNGTTVTGWVELGTVPTQWQVQE